MSLTCPFQDILDATMRPSDPDLGGRKDFPLMPPGQACDMGRHADGRPLIDPRIFDSTEFQRNPYPYYRILRDHHPVRNVSRGMRQLSMRIG